MLASIHSAGVSGIQAFPVLVEVDCASQGLPGWHFTGLPEQAIKESKERVGSALRHSGIMIKAQKTTINLAPARRKKIGNYFDLPIAIGLLIGNGLITPEQVAQHLFIGELQLSGAMQGVAGALSIACHAARHNYTLVGPAANAAEFALVRDLRYLAAESLGDVLAYCAGERAAQIAAPVLPDLGAVGPDLADVKGQRLARRALEIAAAGQHHLMLYGPPGTGKTMLAERLAGILPPLHYDEALETTQIYSAVGRLTERQLLAQRPFRAPHHSASMAGIAGGGTTVRAGEMSLAHHGVLFFDEFPEFHRDALEALRQPLESGTITIVRAEQQATLPARFLFVAACNPCRCGFYGHPSISCTCPMHRVQQYRSKLSGPLMDRIDLHVPVLPMPIEQLAQTQPGESSHAVRTRVLAARARQAERYGAVQRTNGQLTGAQTRQYCVPLPAARKTLLTAIEKYGLSARVYDRLLRISRTIADLAGAEQIDIPHVAEALQFRNLDRPL